MAIINYDGISGISSITATGSSVQFYNATGASSFMTTNSSGVGIGTNNPASSLDKLDNISC